MRVFLSEKCFTLFGNTRVPAVELKQAPPENRPCDCRPAGAAPRLHLKTPPETPLIEARMPSNMRAVEGAGISFLLSPASEVVGESGGLCRRVLHVCLANTPHPPIRLGAGSVPLPHKGGEGTLGHALLPTSRQRRGNCCARA